MKTTGACARERWSRTEVRVVQVDSSDARKVRNGSDIVDELHCRVDGARDSAHDGRQEGVVQDGVEFTEEGDTRDDNDAEKTEGEAESVVDRVERRGRDGVEKAVDDAGEVDRSKVNRQLWWLRAQSRHMSAGGDLKGSTQRGRAKQCSRRRGSRGRAW